MMADKTSSLTNLTADLVAAYLSNNKVRVDDLPALIQSAYDALAAAGPIVVGNGEVEPEFKQVVTVRKSLASRDHIISMIDGKPYRMLKRHLTTNGLTFGEYKERYRLPASYPSIAPSYSEQRSAMAMKIGLGRKKEPARKANNKSD